MNEEEFQEQVEYIRHTLNDMKIKNEDKFLNAVAILYYEYIIQNKEYKKSKLNSNDYIAKKKIKDQLEHYQELQNNYIEKYDEISENIQSMINVLQVLLEESEEN